MNGGQNGRGKGGARHDPVQSQEESRGLSPESRSREESRAESGESWVGLENSRAVGGPGLRGIWGDPSIWLVGRSATYPPGETGSARGFGRRVETVLLLLMVPICCGNKAALCSFSLFPSPLP